MYQLVTSSCSAKIVSIPLQMSVDPKDILLQPTHSSSEDDESGTENEEDKQFIHDKDSDESEVNDSDEELDENDLSEDALDEDDLELLEENLGKSSRKKKNFKRIKRKHTRKDQKALESLFSEDEVEENEAHTDEIEDFVVYDDERDEPREHRKVIQKPTKLAGISTEAWQDMQEIFGDGTEYQHALKPEMDEEMTEAKAIPLEKAFEPSVIAEKMFSSRDDVIRSTDIPERMQKEGASEDVFVEDPLEAEWIAERLVDQFDSQPLDMELFRDAIKSVLKFIRVEKLEVPFIMTHRKEYFTNQLSIEELWGIYDLNDKWNLFKTRYITLKSFFDQLALKYDFSENLVSYFSGFWLAAKTENEVTDLYDFINLYYGKELNDLSSADNDATKKRPLRLSNYQTAVKIGLDKFTVKVGLSAADFGSNLSFGYKKFETADYFETPSQLASHFLNQGFATIEAVENAAIQMIACEIATEPNVRKYARRVLTKKILFSAYPTEKGRREIVDSHEYAYFKYLKDKPLSEFKDEECIELFKAEKSNDIIVNMKFADDFWSEFKSFYQSDGFSASAESWNSFREKVLRHAMDEYLVPMVERETKQEVLESNYRYLATSCMESLQDRLLVGKLKVPEDEFTVMAISWGDGSYNTATMAVIVDQNAGVVSSFKFPQFSNRKNEDLQIEDHKAFKNALREYAPKAIAVAGTTIHTAKLFKMVSSLVYEAYDSRLIPQEIPVTYIEDDVARIYQISDRAQEEFPKYSQLLKYCVSLARRFLDPLFEYAALCNPQNEILCLAFNEHQKMIPDEILSKYLHRAFINTVNLIGIDINQAVQHATAKYALQFVSGLGIRKAMDMVQKVSELGFIDERRALIDSNICGPVVYRNCASFIRIAEQFLPSTYNRRLNPLDSTRIHPESYKIAEQMAADALEVENVRREGDDLSDLIEEIMEQSHKLDELALDDYSKELLSRSFEDKSMTLEDIRAELKNPFFDGRIENIGLPDKIVYSMLTGEDEKSLRVGQIVPVRVVAVQDNHCFCALNNGMSGYLGIREASDDHIASLVGYFHVGQNLNCKIIFLDEAERKVELTCRESVLEQKVQPIKELDAYFDYERQREDKKLFLVGEEKREKNHQSARHIAHPNFRNCNRQVAQQALMASPNGDFVFRPSSKGPNNLTLTWKIHHNLFAHIDIKELDKASEWSLGKTLLIGEERFSCLEEIVGRHLEPMVKFSQGIISHQKFSSLNGTALANRLKEERANNPKRIFYYIGIDPKLPGKFPLVYLPGNSIRKEFISLLPSGYRFRKQHFESIDYLLNWFKKHYKDPIGTSTERYLESNVPVQPQSGWGQVQEPVGWNDEENNAWQ